MHRCSIMKTTIATGAILATAVLHAGRAHAEARTGLGDSGEWIVSAERLFGIAYAKATEVDGATTTTDSRTAIALLCPPIGPGGLSSPHHIPRIALDVDVMGGFTIGGAVGFVSSSGTTKTETAATGTSPSSSSERDAASATTFLLSPRLGYAVSLSSLFTFWPRVSVSYYDISVSAPGTIATGNASGTGTTVVGTVERNFNGIGLGIEPALVLTPLPHVGLVFAPAIDFPLSGSRLTKVSTSPAWQDVVPSSAAPREGDASFFSLGFHFGVLAHF